MRTLFTFLFLVGCGIYVINAMPPINMAGPMTGPGQVPWDADLGVPMIWNGGIWFLEGDSFTNGDRKRAIMIGEHNTTDHQISVGDPTGTRVAGNAIGGCNPLPCKVEWYLNGQAFPIMFIMWPPNVLSCVPAGTVEANGITYIWMMNVVNWGGFAQTHAWSMLLKGTPTPANYVATSNYMGVDSKFVNAAFINMGNVIYIYGTGLYRASPIFMAYVAPENIENQGAWNYLVANASGTVTWSPNQDLALPTIAEALAGELSAIYSTYLQQFVITAFDGPAGLVMYRSKQPWGPWMKEIIFNEAMSYPWKQGMSGSYGGYMVPDQGVNTPTLWMTISFWVPYRTYMISTDLSQLGTGNPIIMNATDMKTGVTYDANTPASATISNAEEEGAQAWDFYDMTWKAKKIANAL